MADGLQRVLGYMDMINRFQTSSTPVYSRFVSYFDLYFLSFRFRGMSLPVLCPSLIHFSLPQGLLDSTLSNQFNCSLQFRKQFIRAGNADWMML